jgi:hypothetical protein
MAEEYQNVNYVKYTKHIFILEVGWGETQFFGTGAYRTCRISGVRLSSLALQPQQSGSQSIAVTDVAVGPHLLPWHCSIRYQP